MCLTQLSEYDKQDELAKLPGTFPCWKVIQTNGYCEYDYNKEEPKFTRKTHTAVDGISAARSIIEYTPSFHAYLAKPRKKLLNRGGGRYRFMIVKCWANKADVVRLGYSAASGFGIMAVAVSKITRK